MAMSKEDARWIDRVIAAAMREVPQAQKVTVCESDLSIEPKFLPSGSEFFIPVMCSPDRPKRDWEIEPDILKVSPCVVISDPDYWLDSNTVAFKALHTAIAKRLGINLVTRDTLIAFVVLHEIFHALHFGDRHWTEVESYIKKEEAKVDLGKDISDYDKERLHRLMPFESQADDWACTVMLHQWSFLFQDEIPAAAALAGTMSAAMFSNIEARIDTAREEEDEKYIRAVERVKAREAARVERETRQKNSLFNRAKRAVSQAYTQVRTRVDDIITKANDMTTAYKAHEDIVTTSVSIGVGIGSFATALAIGIMQRLF
jgi:hypothetical protein